MKEEITIMNIKLDSLNSIDKKIRYSLHSDSFAYLADNPYEEFYEAEIKRATNLSTGGVNKALKDLSEAGLIIKKEKSKFRLYKFNIDNPISRQYKVLLNLRRIWPFVSKYLNQKAEKIVLFGSAARGENLPDSDIDLFVISREQKEINRIIGKSQWAETIQLILAGPAEVDDLDQKLSSEIDKGIVLWEKQND